MRACAASHSRGQNALALAYRVCVCTRWRNARNYYRRRDRPLSGHRRREYCVLRPAPRLHLRCISYCRRVNCGEPGAGRTYGSPSVLLYRQFQIAIKILCVIVSALLFLINCFQFIVNVRVSKIYILPFITRESVCKFTLNRAREMYTINYLNYSIAMQFDAHYFSIPCNHIIVRVRMNIHYR